MKTIEVIYENGVLKPKKKLKFKEGTRLKVIVKPIRVEEFVKASLTEKEICELEKRFENEGIC